MSSQEINVGPVGLSLEKAEQVKAELGRILQSQGFQRSERHSRFLRFVCESTLGGEAAHLNEYLIAHKVFERGSDYSPGEDSVVRRQAFSLRQKLHEYYTTEGKADTVRIELPVGRYIPTFKFEVPSTPPTSIIQATEPPKKPFPPPGPSGLKIRVLPRKVVSIVAIAVLCSATGWFAGVRSQRGTALDPVFSRIWGPWLLFTEGTVICFSNALTAGIRWTDRPFPEDNLTRGIALSAEEAEAIRKQFHFPAGGFFYMNPALAHAKMGEALGSIQLTAMFTRVGVPVRATQSRYLNWQDFRNHNLILLGHDEANQWLDPILNKLPFRLGRTTVDKPRRIVITEPRQGERQEYYPDYSKGRNPPVEDYALISLLNGIDGHHGLALINGVNTEGTMMALDYLTEPVSLRALESALLGTNPRHSGTWHFQAILHSDLRDGVPGGIELIALRDLP
ncbi:MAG: hypothetical protein ACR2I2_04960 [Bryobacteraceae bacterium]